MVDIKRKILIVDADVMAVLEVEGVLKRAGYTIDYLLGPRNLQAKLEHWVPDVLLLDMGTCPEDFSGILASLKERGANGRTVILLLSNMDKAAMQKLCIDFEISGYFSKSSDLEKLAGFIERFF